MKSRKAIIIGNIRAPEKVARNKTSMFMKNVPRHQELRSRGGAAETKPARAPGRKFGRIELVSPFRSQITLEMETAIIANGLVIALRPYIESNTAPATIPANIPILQPYTIDSWNTESAVKGISHPHAPQSVSAKTEKNISRNMKANSGIALRFRVFQRHSRTAEPTEAPRALFEFARENLESTK